MARGYPYLPAKSSNSRPPTLDFTSALLSNSMGNRITSTVSLSRQKSRVHRAMRPLVSPLRARRRRLRRRAAEERDELSPFYLIELHSVPPARAGLHDIELARISQVITERFTTCWPLARAPIRRSGESVWRIRAIEASPAPADQPQ